MSCGTKLVSFSARERGEKGLALQETRCSVPCRSQPRGRCSQGCAPTGTHAGFEEKGSRFGAARPLEAGLLAGARSGLLPFSCPPPAERCSPRLQPGSPRSPLSSCTMPMVPPVLMTSTRASLTALQPGRSWRWVPDSALPSEPRATAASIPTPRNRYLRRKGELDRGRPGGRLRPAPRRPGRQRGGAQRGGESCAASGARLAAGGEARHGPFGAGYGRGGLDLPLVRPESEDGKLCAYLARSQCLLTPCVSAS